MPTLMIRHLLRVLLIMLGVATATTQAGENWQGLGGGADQTVSFVTHDGTDLIALGSFNAIGGLAINRAARWNGTAWRAMGDPSFSDDPMTNGAPVAFLRTAGGTLYVAATTGGATSIFTWNGSAWVAVFGATFNSAVWELAEGPAGLYAVGDFTQVSGFYTARGIALYNGSSWSEESVKAT